MIWLIAMEYLFNKRPQICFVCRNYNTVLYSFMTFYRICSKSDMKEQELLTAPVHLGSPPCFSKFHVRRSLIIWVMFCWSLIVLLSFIFCLVCTSPIYSFSLLPYNFLAFLLLGHNARRKKVNRCSLLVDAYRLSMLNRKLVIYNSKVWFTSYFSFMSFFIYVIFSFTGTIEESESPTDRK